MKLKWKDPLYRQRIIESHKGKTTSEDTKEKMRLAHLGRKYHRKKPAWNKGIKLPQISGENHYLWIKDRSKLKIQNERNDPEYKQWRKKVWSRDKFKCRIGDDNCEGRIEAHHILSWSEHPELRYNPNNGITLCHAHHPRKRAEEKRLIPTFQELVSVSKV